MQYLPLFHRIEGNKCLVVGGGDIALRKSRLLLKAGAHVSIVAPQVLDSLQALVSRQGEVIQREFTASDLDGAAFVIAATNQLDVNRKISELAQSQNIPVNVVDQPGLCSVIIPAIIDRSPMVFAISSGGTSPVLARQYKARLDSLLPSRLGNLAGLAKDFRQQVRERLPDINVRRRFWETALYGRTASLALADRLDEAEQQLQQELENFATDSSKHQGEVYLVGAGPGDPELLTFKALRLMQQAEVVLYDRLVSQDIIDMCRKDADYIYVGKAQSKHTVPQNKINDLLVEHALAGKRVLRLKGGDPFIFGRGGEEIEQLAEQGIHFEVVPGITAASGCAAYSGIPLTHRDYAHSVRFITGHLKDNQLELPWKELVHQQQTVVFYMGLTGVTTICSELIRHGRAKHTPVALIEKGTSPEQRNIISTLEELPAVIEASDVSAPTLIIVGEVVQLHSKLNWYGNKAF